MNLREATILAERLMQENGLTDYRFQFDNARRRFGLCSTARKLISLSAPLVSLNEESQVKSTILHEIAHALTPGHHHDEVWRATAIRLGDTGERCYSKDEVATPEPNYIYACSKCNIQFPRIQRMKRYGTRYHRSCGPVEGKLKRIK